MDDHIQEDYAYAHMETGFGDYLVAIRKRWWLILSIFVFAVVTTYINTSRMEPVYRAQSKVLIERYNPYVLRVQEVLPLDAWSTDYYQTQYKILESRSLAKNVVETLKLNESPEFNREPQRSLFPFNIRESVASVLNVVMAREGGEESPDPGHAYDPLAPYINLYRSRLRIDPIPESRLVNISFEGHDPVLIAQVANVHAQAYIDKNLEMKLSASEDAVDWLSGRLDELKLKLKESEEALQKFREQEDIIALENVLSAEGRQENIVAQRLAELNANLTQARTERIGLATLHSQLRELAAKPGMVESIPQVIENGFIQALKGDYVELNRQYSELQEKYGDKHPRMIALKNEMRGIQGKIASEVAKINKSLEIQKEVAIAKERSLQNALEVAKRDVMGLNKKAIEYGVLKREVDSNRQLYDMILQRAKETSLTSGLKSTNIFIVDLAEIPRAPIKPQVRRSVTMAAILSLMAGLGLALFVQYLDNTIHSPDEVRRYLNVPFLGPVGLANSNGRSFVSELAVLREPKSKFSESLRTVRTNVVFSLIEPEQKTLMISSPGPMEGKTFIASNLAVMLAKMGRRVLLVDADMRKPRVHKIFNTSCGPGLSNVVLHKCSVKEAIRGTRLKSLKLLPAGTIPPNPSELLGSRSMVKVIDELKAYFDYLIFDTPPILAVTDAAVLGGMLDGTILVIKASETTRQCARRTIEQLLGINARVMGVVLNQVNFQKDPYYNYYYKYDYYYTNEGQKRRRRILRSGNVRSTDRRLRTLVPQPLSSAGGKKEGEKVSPL
jgi:succinoglycan biosynthesis transport protein ExoP